jgi:hypothetical protein
MPQLSYFVIIACKEFHCVLYTMRVPADMLVSWLSWSLEFSTVPVTGLYPKSQLRPVKSVKVCSFVVHCALIDKDSFLLPSVILVVGLHGRWVS